MLLQEASDSDWRSRVLEQNVLQMGSVASITRISRLLRARLEPLGEGLWRLVRDGGREQATQAVFAGAIKNSRLLGDFMDIALRERRMGFAEKIAYGDWNDFIDGCRGRDPEMPV